MEEAKCAAWYGAKVQSAICSQQNVVLVLVGHWEQKSLLYDRCSHFTENVCGVLIGDIVVFLPAFLSPIESEEAASRT